MRRFACSFLALTLLASHAYAQDDNSNSALNERLDRLERDVNFVQKQVYRGSATDSSGAPMPANAGQLQVRFSQIDEEIRQIRGLIEQTQFQNRQNAVDLKKLSDDVDYRLRAIEQKQAEAALAPAPVAQPEAEAEAAPAPAPAPAPVPTKAAATAADGKFADANAHYSHAFKLLSDKKYSEAATSFDQFVKKYPSDSLTPNAYYWLGESQYSRNDFTRATESFRKGFEANPDGQKAPDNLYKLAMSLAEVKRKSESCVVLNQVVTKYAETAPRTVAKAQAALTSMSCK